MIPKETPFACDQTERSDIHPLTHLALQRVLLDLIFQPFLPLPDSVRMLPGFIVNYQSLSQLVNAQPLGNHPLRVQAGLERNHTKLNANFLSLKREVLKSKPALSCRVSDLSQNQWSNNFWGEPANCFCTSCVPGPLLYTLV